VALEWIERHCVIPDGWRAGEPLRLYRFQAEYLARFYEVLPTAERGQLAPAFRFRRGILVGPQKVGKNPLVAAQICLEGLGPALFDGWAEPGEVYDCADHGCPCGWVYAYGPGEPKGAPWPTPLIQITAYSEEATDNTYDALRPMIERGPLADVVPRTGEAFIRLPGGGRIDTVTSSDRSRLGQRVTFVAQDEVGLWTPTTGMVRVADTQYRNLAGMGGRATLTTNAWDPGAGSVAQREWDSAADDIYRQMIRPPATLSFANKAERRRILRIAYPEDVRREHGGHVDLDAIEAEAADLAEKDLAQAARFFGNIIMAASGRAFDPAVWAKRAAESHPVGPRARIVLGFDGSRRYDHTALVGCEVETGYLWPLGIWAPPPGGEISTEEIDAAVDEAFALYDVVRLYADPPYWDESVARWAGRYGDRVRAWWTARSRPMANALRAFAEAVELGDLRHCPPDYPGCAALSAHVANAVKRPTSMLDDDGRPLWLVGKDQPGSPAKIDGLVAAVLAWEARRDALAQPVTRRSVYEERGILVLKAT
jgi:hypothetical protein